MHRTLAVALALAALASPLPARGQEAAPASGLQSVLPASAPAGAPTEDVLGPAAWTPLSSKPGAAIPPAEFFAAAAAREWRRQGAARSLSRHVLVGAGIGAIAGAALGLWVISIADCGGPGCTAERVMGVAGNALGGAAIGALIGAVVHRVRR